MCSRVFKIFTLQPFHYIRSILSLSVCQLTLRFGKNAISKSNYRSHNSIELLWLHVITYIHTCNIAQNWKSIVEEITRDRFTLADLFHETRATYRKRVIKTVLRDSLYNTKRYRSCYFSTRYAWWALLLSVRGPWWTWIATVLPYIFNNRFVFSFIKPAYYSRERKYTGNDRERESKRERGEKKEEKMRERRPKWRNGRWIVQLAGEIYRRKIGKLIVRSLRILMKV